MRNSNKLEAEDMLLLMELAGKTVVVERDKTLLVNIFLPEHRWAAFEPLDKKKELTYFQQAMRDIHGLNIHTGWTKRQAVRKAFDSWVKENGEAKN